MSTESIIGELQPIFRDVLALGELQGLKNVGEMAELIGRKLKA